MHRCESLVSCDLREGAVLDKAAHTANVQTVDFRELLSAPGAVEYALLSLQGATPPHIVGSI